MNYLSWLLWLADLLGNLKLFFFGLSVATLIFLLCRWITFNILDDTYKSELRYSCFRENAKKPVFPQIKNYVVFSILTMLICAVLPAQSTVYAIAASQVGEQVLKTPLAGKAEHALESWLNKQIKDNGG